MKRVLIFLLGIFSFSFAGIVDTCNLLYETAGECYIKAEKMNIKNEEECSKVVEVLDNLIIGTFPDITIKGEKLEVLNSYCLVGCKTRLKGNILLSREEFVSKCVKLSQ